MKIQYWIPSGDFTADGRSTFVEVRVGKPHGINCIEVTLDDHDNLLDAEMIRKSEGVGAKDYPGL